MTQSGFVQWAGCACRRLSRVRRQARRGGYSSRGFTEGWAGPLELIHNRSRARVTHTLRRDSFYAESARELGVRLLRLLGSLGSTMSSGRMARSRAVESFILKSSEKISESG